MTDFESTLDAIDEVAVHHCGHCDTPLGPDAPSGLFCNSEHQAAFYEARSEALVGYREPTDIPAHIYNQLEESSSETTPTGWFDGALSMALTGNAYFQVVRDEWSEDGVRTISLHTTGDDIQWMTTNPRLAGEESWARNGSDGVHVSWGPPAGVDSRWLQIGLGDWSVSAEFELGIEMSDVTAPRSSPYRP